MTDLEGIIGVMIVDIFAMAVVIAYLLPEASKSGDLFLTMVSFAIIGLVVLSLIVMTKS